MSSLANKLYKLIAAAPPALVDADRLKKIDQLAESIVSALRGDLTYPHDALRYAREIREIVRSYHVTTAFNKNNYPVKLTLELTHWEGLRQFIEFWRIVRDTANGGHSFDIEADRADLGDKAPKVGIDGDGADHIGRILLNDKDVTEDKSGKKTDRAIKSIATNKTDLSKLSNDEVAARVQNEKLSHDERVAAYDEFKRRGLLQPKRKPKQRSWNRASTLANDNPHSAVIDSLMNAGYRYHGKKVAEKLTHHTLKYHSKATPAYNDRIKHILTQHGFTHTKTPKGHDYRRSDAHIRIESVPGATRLQYVHRNLPNESTAADAELEGKIAKLLKQHKFIKDKKIKNRFNYKGILNQTLYKALDKDMIGLGLTPSPSRSALSWYERNKGILVSINGKTGEEYYAIIQNF